MLWCSIFFFSLPPPPGFLFFITAAPWLSFIFHQRHSLVFYFFITVTPGIFQLPVLGNTAEDPSLPILEQRKILAALSWFTKKKKNRILVINTKMMCFSWGRLQPGKWCFSAGRFINTQIISAILFWDNADLYPVDQVELLTSKTNGGVRYGLDQLWFIALWFYLTGLWIAVLADGAAARMGKAHLWYLMGLDYVHFFTSASREDQIYEFLCKLHHEGDNE